MAAPITWLECGLRGRGLKKVGTLQFAAIDGHGGQLKGKRTRKKTRTTTVQQQQHGARVGLMVRCEKKVKVRLRIDHQVISLEKF